MRIQFGPRVIDIPRLFPRYRPPNGIVGMLLYSLVMFYVYVLLVEIYVAVVMVAAAIWLIVLLYQWIRYRNEVLAWRRAQREAYENELRQRADQQNADWLAGGTGLPEAPLTQARSIDPAPCPPMAPAYPPQAFPAPPPVIPTPPQPPRLLPIRWPL